MKTLIAIAALFIIVSCQKEEAKTAVCYTCEVIVRSVPQPFISPAVIDTTYYENCDVDTITPEMEGLSQDGSQYVFRSTTCTVK